MKLRFFIGFCIGFFAVLVFMPKFGLLFERAALASILGVAFGAGACIRIREEQPVQQKAEPEAQNQPKEPRPPKEDFPKRKKKKKK